MRQRLGIGERLGVLHLPPVDDVANRKFGDLARPRARDVGNGDDMARADGAVRPDSDA